jgi:hypothetical protein
MNTKYNHFPSKFVKPTRIGDELAKFLEKPFGSEMARTEVTRDINKYIRTNNLQDKENSRKINPDSKLAALFKLKKTDELTYFNLQKHLSHHFFTKAVGDTEVTRDQNVSSFPPKMTRQDLTGSIRRNLFGEELRCQTPSMRPQVTSQRERNIQRHLQDLLLPHVMTEVEDEFAFPVMTEVEDEFADEIKEFEERLKKEKKEQRYQDFKNANSIQKSIPLVVATPIYEL